MENKSKSYGIFHALRKGCFLFLSILIDLLSPDRYLSNSYDGKNTYPGRIISVEQWLEHTLTHSLFLSHVNLKNKALPSQLRIHWVMPFRIRFSLLPRTIKFSLKLMKSVKCQETQNYMLFIRRFVLWLRNSRACLRCLLQKKSERQWPRPTSLTGGKKGHTNQSDFTRLTLPNATNTL